MTKTFDVQIKASVRFGEDDRVSITSAESRGLVLSLAEVQKQSVSYETFGSGTEGCVFVGLPDPDPDSDSGLASRRERGCCGTQRGQGWGG